MHAHSTTVDMGHRERKRTLLIARLYYFALFGALGAIAPFFNIYLQQRGLSGTQIGLISTMPPIVALVASPLWGAIADRWQAHQRVLALLAFLAGASSLAFIRVDQFWSILLVLCLVALFRSPIAAILDATVMGFVARYDVSYGPQRVFGSFGWILMSYGVGFLVSSWSIYAIFWLHGLLLALMCTILSLSLPVERSRGSVQYMQGLRQLTGRPSYRSLMLFMIAFGASTACHVNFGGLNMLRLGGTATLVGLTTASGAFLEIPMMFLGARWFRRVSYRSSVVVGAVGFTVIWLFIAAATRPWHILLANSFIGVFFGLVWMAVVGYANDSAPDGFRATAQAVSQAAQSGLGWAIGSALSGVLWDIGSGRAVFLAAALIIAAGGTVFHLGTRHNAETHTPSRQQTV